MRPLPLKTAAGLPASVLGVSIVRGVPLPVLSLSAMLSQPASTPTRFVVLQTGPRDCVLAVDAICDIATMDPEEWRQKPRLLRRIELADRLAAEDDDLVVSLDAARLIAEIPAVESLPE